MIYLRDVNKKFGTVAAVDNVSLALQQGQLMALLGPSGCGKTTTLRLIAGFESIDSGEIEIGGQVVAKKRHHLPPEQRRTGMVFQEYALFPHLNVAKNVQFGLHSYPGNKDRRMDHVLDLVGLTGFEKRMPHELSGGQQQRVALARALAPEPDVILLDEPFSNLDASLRMRVRTEVRDILRHAHATAIFVTHDQEEALSLVDQIAVMMDGKVHQVAPPHRLYQQPSNRQVAEFIGDTNFLPGTAYGHTVECELGVLQTQVEENGAVDVLVRPEYIKLTLDKQTAHTVCDISFLGHDQLVSIRLNSGMVIQSRHFTTRSIQMGQTVQIEVALPVMVYPTQI